VTEINNKPDLLLRFKESQSTLLEAMRSQRLVQGDEGLAKQLLSAMELVSVDPQSAIITQGAADDDVYFILAGRFDIIVNGRVIAQRGPGEQVGEMAATVSFLRRSATVQARESSVVGRISATSIGQIGFEYPLLWKQIAKSLAERLLQRNSQIADINARCRVFIISSAEALSIARAVQESFVQDNVSVVVWTDGVFRASQYTVESLVQQLDVSDFAIAIAQADDLAKSRGEEKPVPRDNVLFELGLFIGRLGRHRSFLLEPLRTGVKLPSDLSGITTIPYKPGADAELLAGVAPACNQLRRYFNELGPK
jgi:CRP/FNR family transcriptional regulator, cyclic AMP receptor protein